jgi:pectinesterase
MKKPATLLAAAMLCCTGAVAADRPVYRVAHDCAGASRCYATVEGALQGAGSSGWAVVALDAGDFYEKVTIRRAQTILRGKGVGRTRLYFDAVAQTAGHFHRANWGTPGSATLTIDADRVSVENLTVENSFDFLKNDALPEGNPAKIGNAQAVAVLLDIHSDRVGFNNTALLGYQDTLFANGARATIRNSLIAGNIDFIFGNGQVLIEDSEIRTRQRSATFAADEVQSFVVAPSTQLSQRMGIVFHRSRLTRENGVPDNAVALGRPWHPTTVFPDGRYADPNAVGQASFIDCFMDAHIRAEHWTTMNGTARDGSKTAVFRPQDSRFAESGSYGPGARHSDSGITWAAPISIQDVYETLFKGWPQPKP